MKVAVGLRRVAAGKRTSGRRAAQIASLCLLCLAVVVATLLMSPVSGGTSLALSLVAGTPAATAMGVSTAATAVLTAAAGGGIHVLKNLRKRTIKEMGEDHIILTIPRKRKGKKA